MRKKKTFYLSTITLLTILMILSCVIIICFCDAKVWKPFETWTFLLQAEKDKTLYNIAISYVAAYIFYILQVYIPEKKKEEGLIPLRAAMQREVQFFTVWIVILWMSYYEYAIKQGKLKPISKSVDSIFAENNMYDVLKHINLSDISPQIATHTSKYTWKNYTIDSLTKIINWGDKIIANRAAELPPEIYYAIFYIAQESSIVAMMQKALSLSPSLQFTITTLSQAMPVDVQLQKIDLNTDITSIKTLINWVNAEYSFLTSQKKYIIPSIYEIDISSYAKW